MRFRCAILLLAASLCAQDAGRVLVRVPFTDPWKLFNAIAISNDAKIIAQAGYSLASEEFIQIWDRKSARLLRSIPVPVERTKGLAFSPNDKVLASFGTDDKILLWDWRKGRKLRSLDGHSAEVVGLAFFPDGLVFASTSLDRTVRIWRTANGAGIRRLNSGTACTEIVFSPAGKLLAGCSASKVMVWETASGKLKRSVELPVETAIKGLAFTADGTGVLTGAGANSIARWSVATGVCTEKWQVKKADAKFFRLSPDGKTIAIACSDEVGIWKSDGSTKVGDLSFLGLRVSDVRFSADGRWIVTANHHDRGRIFDAATLRAPESPLTHWAVITAMASSQKGPWLATGSATGEVLLWDVRRAKVLRAFEGHRARIVSLAFSPDAKTLVSVSEKSASVWDCGAGRLRQKLEAAANSTTVTFSSDPKRLFSGGPTGSVRIFATDTWELTRKVVSEIAPASQVVVSPDYEAFAVCAPKRPVRVLAMSDGRCLIEFEAPGERVCQLAFDKDGHHLAVATEAGDVVVWNLASRKKVFTRKLTTSGPIAFSPDRNILAVSQWGLPVHLWGIPGGKKIASFKIESRQCYDICFVRQGRELAASFEDGTVRLFRVR